MEVFIYECRGGGIIIAVDEKGKGKEKDNLKASILERIKLIPFDWNEVSPYLINHGINGAGCQFVLTEKG